MDGGLGSRGKLSVLSMDSEGEGRSSEGIQSQSLLSYSRPPIVAPFPFLWFRNADHGLRHSLRRTLRSDDSRVRRHNFLPIRADPKIFTAPKHTASLVGRPLTKFVSLFQSIAVQEVAGDLRQQKRTIVAFPLLYSFVTSARILCIGKGTRAAVRPNLQDLPARVPDRKRSRAHEAPSFDIVVAKVRRNY